MNADDADLICVIRVHLRFHFQLLNMKRTVSSILKVIGIASLCCTGVILLVGLLNPGRLNPPVKSDFLQDYFLARAVISGIDPYVPLNELGVRFGIPDDITHSSTHPPSFAVLCLPLGLLSFRQAAYLWLLVGLTSLLISLRLLFDVRGPGLPLIFLAALTWPPLWFDLSLGQLMIPQLLLLTLAWRGLRTKRDLIAGVLLGLTISIKLIAWPLLFLLLVRKRFTALYAALGVFAFTNLMALLLMGIHPVFTYYFRSGREIAQVYGNNAFNFSAWTIGARLFQGTTTVDAAWFHTMPLIDAPALATLASIVSVSAILLCAFFVALKAQDFDTSFAVLVSTSVIISPVAWIFYLTLILISFAKLRMAADWKTYGIIGVGLLAPFVSQSALPLFGSSTSFAVGLLTIFPMFAVLLMITVLYCRDYRDV
jgi:Glycosyltransferase family 87